MLTESEAEWFKVWISPSIPLAGAWGVEFGSLIQEIGRVELELRRREAQYERSMQKGDERGMLSLEATNLFPLSVAWVLMAFEMLRTLIARIERENPAFRSQRQHPLHKAKTVINRLRTRLAKHQAAGNSGDSWNHVVLGRRGPMHVGWFLQEKEFVTRRDLADILASALANGHELKDTTKGRA